MNNGKGTLRLLPPAALIRTSDVDHADWNYRAFLGQIQRIRFRVVCRLLGEQRYPRLLEIGYGSGVLMPELKQRCDELYGIDPHSKHREVAAALAQHGVVAELYSGSAEVLPFANGFFDAVVSVSALEYVPDIERACREIRRVLRPGGDLVVVTPGHSALLDLGLRIATGESAGQYENRRERLLPALKAHFAVVAEKPIPWVTGPLFRLYTGIKLQAR